jgi:uncharacterized protein YbjT (DUF2867 family)
LKTPGGIYLWAGLAVAGPDFFLTFAYKTKRMKYVLLGSVGHITKPLAQQLLAAGQGVVVVTSQAAHQEEIAALGAESAVGSVEDTAFLAKTFQFADAVYTMVPPKFDAKDWKKFIAGVGKNFASALKGSGVKKVVNLSSIGAHMPTGCGPVSGLHFVEQALNGLEGVVDVKHLRPAYFYVNFYGSIGMIKQGGIYGNNFGADRVLPMVHPNDIAAVAAEELLGLRFAGTSIRYIAGDEKTSLEITRVLGAAIGKPELPYVPFSDEDFLQGALQAGFPEEIARNYVEMGAAIRNGEMDADYQKHKGPLTPTKLKDFAKEFAVAYAGA